jgi:hypothetical protein
MSKLDIAFWAYMSINVYIGAVLLFTRWLLS